MEAGAVRDGGTRDTLWKRKPTGGRFRVHVKQASLNKRKETFPLRIERESPHQSQSFYVERMRVRETFARMALLSTDLMATKPLLVSVTEICRLSLQHYPAHPDSTQGESRLLKLDHREEMGL